MTVLELLSVINMGDQVKIIKVSTTELNKVYTGTVAELIHSNGDFLKYPVQLVYSSKVLTIEIFSGCM